MPATESQNTKYKRKLGAWHRFKIRNNRPAQKSIAYLFKITQCLEVFSTLLPAVALEQYSSEKAKQALVEIKEKIEPSVKQQSTSLTQDMLSTLKTPLQINL